MALTRYKCANEHNVILWGHEEVKCPECQSTDLTRVLKAPLKAKINDKVDTYHNVDAEAGVQDQTRERSKQHVQDTLDEMIDQFGEAIAKEQGWIIYDSLKKVWRKRDNWDQGLLNKFNSGSKEALRKK